MQQIPIMDYIIGILKFRDLLQWISGGHQAESHRGYRVVQFS